MVDDSLIADILEAANNEIIQRARYYFIVERRLAPDIDFSQSSEDTRVVEFAKHAHPELWRHFLAAIGNTCVEKVIY